MKLALLDVNVLIALAWPVHVHHRVAHQWFARNAAFGWVTCPLTQLAFVRISSNPKIIRNAVSPRQAIELLGRNISHPNHIFWPDDLSFAEASSMLTETLVSHRQVTDRYLLALARSKNGKLATLDRKMADLLLATGSPSEILELLPTD